MFDLERVRESTAAEIRAEMARKKITAASLSARTGMPAATLSRKLNGHVGFTLDELLKVTGAIDISAADILRSATAETGAA